MSDITVKDKICKGCGCKLTEKNVYKYRGFTNLKCKDCRNTYGREIARKKAKHKNQWKIF